MSECMNERGGMCAWHKEHPRLTAHVTDGQLDQWQRLADGATPGPWQWSPRLREPWPRSEDGPTLETVARTIDEDDGSEIAAHEIVYAMWGYDTATIEVSDSDAEFIATAREALPLLIAEVRKLRESGAS